MSKIFERTGKILNMVKNIWTWPKKFWTSRWIKHWSKNYFSEKIWWTSEQICLFEWSTLYQWKTVLQIIIWKCWRTDAYCLHSHSGPGLSKIWLYFFKTTGKSQYGQSPSIRDRVHRNEYFVEIIPVFSTFFTFFKKKKNYKRHFM